VKRYADLRGLLSDAVHQFAAEVLGGSYPAEEHSYH